MINFDNTIYFFSFTSSQIHFLHLLFLVCPTSGFLLCCYFIMPLSTISISQLLLGMVPSLKYGRFTRCHTIIENLLYFSQKLSNTNSPSWSCWVLCPSPPYHAGILSNSSFSKSYVICHNGYGFICASVKCGKHHFLLLYSFCRVFVEDPKPWGRGVIGMFWLG